MGVRLLHLLIRRISPYTHANLLLGAYSRFDQVKAAQKAYRRRYEQEPEADPWRDQAYVETSFAPDHVIIKSLPLQGEDEGEEAFVVSVYSEAFGQVLREFDAVYTTEALAQRRAEELEQVEDRFPRYVLIQRVQAGVPLSDRPEAQPA